MSVGDPFKMESGMCLSNRIWKELLPKWGMG